MRAGMLVLAALCVVLAVAPTVIVPVLSAAAVTLTAAPATPVTLGDGGTVVISGRFATLSMPAIAVALGLALLVPLAALRLVGANRSRRVSDTWGCGRILQTARMEYTATAFSSPFRRVFDFFYRPEKSLDLDVHPESRFFVRRIVYGSPTRSIFDDWLYVPVMSALRRTSATARAIQSGSANLYLAYILAALVVLLVIA